MMIFDPFLLILKVPADTTRNAHDNNVEDHESPEMNTYIEEPALEQQPGQNDNQDRNV